MGLEFSTPGYFYSSAYFEKNEKNINSAFCSRLFIQRKEQISIPQSVN